MANGTTKRNRVLLVPLRRLHREGMSSDLLRCPTHTLETCLTSALDIFDDCPEPKVVFSLTQNTFFAGVKNPIKHVQHEIHILNPGVNLCGMGLWISDRGGLLEKFDYFGGVEVHLDCFADQLG